MTTEYTITTDHEACAELVEVLAGQGVRNVVISPGSRNAPLIVAFAREKRIENHVIDHNLFKRLGESLRPKDFFNFSLDIYIKASQTSKAIGVEKLFKEMKYMAE